MSSPFKLELVHEEIPDFEILQSVFEELLKVDFNEPPNCSRVQAYFLFPPHDISIIINEKKIVIVVKFIFIFILVYRKKS